MGQTLPSVSVSTGSAVSGLWNGSGGKSTAGQEAAGVTFDQTLLTMLAGGVKPQEGQFTGQLALLAGLANQGEGLNAEGEGSEDLNALLEGLMQQLDGLDEALAENEDLLAMLQGWLLNVQTLLQNNAAGQANAEGAGEMALSALGENPQTVKFAVQDALLQLAATSAAKASGVQNAGEDAVQAKTLMESLQSMLASAGLNGEKPATGKTFAQTAHAQANLLDGNSQQLGQAGQTGNPNPQIDRANVQIVTQTANAAEIGSQALNIPAVINADDSAEMGNEGNDGDHPLQSGSIVTAGQLALRESATAPLKTAATPHVPVEKFGEEMGRFIVSKLDIVKAGGTSEARISLYPEHLGQVDVRITLQNGHMIAQFMTEHAFAKESLEAQMAQLRQALQAQGLQVGKLEVTQNAALSSHMYQDGRQQGSGGNQQQGEKRQRVAEEIQTVNDLSEEWNEWLSGQHAGEEGYSFTAKA
ncbi:flagellar hook-length control protein FliK [Paenibacillus sp. M1]|uniref:Flagellar hook-length control protein FliK n=1 Tax=Paenibacillus haidiansis TaxID=1574488 RepID=A0ABU7VN73_9BACL